MAEPSPPAAVAAVETNDNVKTLQRHERVSKYQEVVESLRADPLYTTVSDIVHWREPVRSGLIFAIIVLWWFLVSVAEYSVITLVAYLYLGVFLASFGLVQYSNFSNKPHLLKARLGDISDVLTREQSRGHAETVYKGVDALTILARDGLFFTDVAFSLKVFGATLTLAILGNYVSLPTLCFTASIFLFAIPRIYEEKKEQIDAAIAKGLAVANEKLSPVLSKVPVEKLKLKQE